MRFRHERDFSPRGFRYPASYCGVIVVIRFVMLVTFWFCVEGGVILERNKDDRSRNQVPNKDGIELEIFWGIDLAISSEGESVAERVWRTMSSEFTASEGSDLICISNHIDRAPRRSWELARMFVRRGCARS